MSEDYCTPDIANKFTNWKTRSKVVKYIEEPNMLKLVGELSGKTVIDYGCGTGHYTRLLASRADKVIGVDASEHMLNLAKVQTDSSFKNIEYKRDDCGNIFDYGKHDVAISVYFISCASSREILRKFLTSMFHSLKPGAICTGLTVDHSVLGYDDAVTYNVTCKRIENENTHIDELLVTFYNESNGEKMIELKHYLIPHDIIEETFKEAGFVNFKWVQLELPKEHEEHKHHFIDYLQNKGTVMFYAEKPAVD